MEGCDYPACDQEPECNNSESSCIRRNYLQGKWRHFPHRLWLWPSVEFYSSDETIFESGVFLDYTFAEILYIKGFDSAFIEAEFNCICGVDLSVISVDCGLIRLQGLMYFVAQSIMVFAFYLGGVDPAHYNISTWFRVGSIFSLHLCGINMYYSASHWDGQFLYLVINNGLVLCMSKYLCESSWEELVMHITKIHDSSPRYNAYNTIRTTDCTAILLCFYALVGIHVSQYR